MPKQMKKKPQAAPVDAVRINRYLSMCGVSSRRKADEMILAGEVSVNGKVMVDLGAKIIPGKDKVFARGKQVSLVHDLVYLVMNKPKDAITTLSDEKGRTTVMSLIRTKHRVYPIGRLDRNTTGVLLFTNDGDFANALMHPKHEVPKSYQVTLSKPIDNEHVEQLKKGIRLADGKTGPAEVYIIPGGKGKEIGIVIHEGRNRQVRRMFEKFEYEVVKLDRVAYGPVSREGIARGGTRPLTKGEIRELKAMAGLTDETSRLLG